MEALGLMAWAPNYARMIEPHKTPLPKITPVDSFIYILSDKIFIYSLFYL